MSSRYELFLFPAAFIVAIFVSHLGGVIPVLLWVNSIPFHECGHALIYWLRGIPAVPSFGLTVPFTEELVPWFFLLLFAALLFALMCAWNCGSIALCALSGVSISFLLLFSFVLDKRSAELVTIYSGQGGELVLSALICISYYAPWPQSNKAQQLRYALLFCAALAFVTAFRRWIGVAGGGEDLPLGGLFDFGPLTEGESSGDINRLLREFGWSERYLIGVYVKTAWVSAIGIAIFYSAQFLFKERDSHN